MILDREKREGASVVQRQLRAEPDKRSVQMKGMSYGEGAARLSPAAGTPALQLKPGDVAGPMGRVFNRILGVAEGRTDTAGMAFDKGQLKAYLDKTIGLAEGEFFRGTKLDGVADKLMETLDTDKNGKVGWPEFQVFEGQVLQTLAPGVGDGATPEQAADAAGQRFGQLDNDRQDGKLSYDELHAGTKAALPRGTDHADLVAQLGARIALDAVDTNQRGAKVKDRQIDKQEWTTAASEMAKNRQR